MNLLITGTDTPLVAPLLASLGQRHRVRTLGTGARGDSHLAGDLRDPEVAQRAVASIDTIIHLAPLSPTLEELPGGEALDWLCRGTYNLYNAAIEAGVARVIQASTLNFFAPYPTDSRPEPHWRPLPDTSMLQLAPYLAERSAWQVAAATGLSILVLRTGVITAQDNPGLAALTAIHPADAVAGFAAALEAGPKDPRGAFHIAHIVGQGETAVGPGRSASLVPGYEAQHPAPRVERPTDRIPGRALTPRGWQRVDRRFWPGLTQTTQGGRRPLVVLFGAGGPVLSATAEVAKEQAALRLTDLVSLEEAAADPQAPHAPVPGPVAAPHQERRVDITDPEQVREACRGMNLAINGAVVRGDLAGAFRVNLMGCYHVLAAAVAEGIPRVVHSGPQLVGRAYTHDYAVPSDAPPRPGLAVYGHSKYLSFELCRVFAEEHDVTIPNITFNLLLNPARDDKYRTLPMMAISWRDAGRAVWAAATVPDAALPAPYVPLHITADLPHGRAHNEDARRYLGWAPEDTLEDQWRRF